MKEIDWNMASNSQIKEELKRLDTEFKEKQNTVKDLVAKIEDLDEEMHNISKSYVDIQKILYKREGRIK